MEVKIMTRKIILFYLVPFVLLFSCSSIIQHVDLEQDSTYTVLPFENYTDTPMAGYTVASILEASLRAKGIKVARTVWTFKDREPSKEELEKLFKEVSHNADYIITGTVNEFRYKTGIDGEPAVSLSVFIYDAKKGTIIKGLSASASGWSHESLGTITQKLIRDIFQ